MEEEKKFEEGDPLLEPVISAKAPKVWFDKKIQEGNVSVTSVIRDMKKIISGKKWKGENPFTSATHKKITLKNLEELEDFVARTEELGQWDPSTSKMVKGQFQIDRGT